MNPAVTELESHLPALKLAEASVPLVPELRLWLLDPALPTGRLPHDVQRTLLEAPPYWAFCWGSGAVLARYLLDHPESVRGKTVLDVGAGSGVVGIAAALAGAARVVACDTDPVALFAARVNARQNGVCLDVSHELIDADVLVTADVLYDQDNLQLLRSFRQRATTVLVADSRVRDFREPGYAAVWEAECHVTPELDEAEHVNRVRIYRAAR